MSKPIPHLSTKLRAMALQRKNFPEQDLLYAAANAIDVSNIIHAQTMVKVSNCIGKIEEILDRP